MENEQRYSADVTVEFPCPQCNRTIRHPFQGARNMLGVEGAPMWGVEGDYRCSGCDFVDRVTVLIRDHRATAPTD